MPPQKAGMVERLQSGAPDTRRTSRKARWIENLFSCSLEPSRAQQVKSRAGGTKVALRLDYLDHAVQRMCALQHALDL